MARVKKPTLKRKVEVYERLLHNIQLHYAVTCNNEELKKLLEKISTWSYAHRCGNGEYSDNEQQEYINRCFEKLDK